MITRREYLGMSLAAGAAIGLKLPLASAQQGRLIERAIPSSGERIPVIGLGSSATFSEVAREGDRQRLGEVLQTLLEHGGKLFDTAPGYGASEEVAGAIARELGINRRLFWATKVNVAPRGGGPADPAAARQQIETSFQRFGVEKIDLIQVHNVGDLQTQYPILKELKQQGRVRYIGVTTTFPNQYQTLIDFMRREQLDFIGVDYAVDNRDVEETILPLAQERGIGVLAYAPFGRTSLFRRVGDRPLPEWAAEFDAKSWAQFFIKFTLSHPAIVAVTPATSRKENMVDNIGGGIGRVPDAALRRRMIEFIDALPPPPPRT